MYLNIVETHNAGKVCGSAESPNFFVPLFNFVDQVWREGGVENVDNVAEGGVDDLVVVGQAVELLRLQVQVDPMTDADAVGVRVGVVTATLKLV